MQIMYAITVVEMDNIISDFEKIRDYKLRKKNNLKSL